MLVCVQYFSVFTFGALAYGAMEVLFRGYTHWSMLLTGGICFLLFHVFNMRFPQLPLLAKCIAGCFIITALELTAGLILNCVLKMNVWDYSAHALNFMGQICPLFSFFWFLMGIPMNAVSFVIRDIFALIIA